MMENVLNQVLLHKNSRVGADYILWKNSWGGQGLKNAMERPADIVSMIRDAGLLGLGGSGFPTHIKWQAIADQTNTEKYLICNGNEDEPGTFKDRVLLEETPFQVIEGATIAALACGINNVVFYINPNLKTCHEVMQSALAKWLASEIYHNALQQGLNLKYTIVASSGHYIAGEETAAIESVEGKFPFPRGKEPRPTSSGVNGHPTLINNIETLCNVPHILRNGVQWYRDLGIGEANGTKIYCLSGDVLSPGVYELPMGTPLTELIFNYGQGMLVGKELKAVFTGGPSNTILTEKDLDVNLDFKSVSERRSALGTGAMIVVSRGTGIVKRVAQYVDFFAAESCGQCPACKTGTYYMSQLLGEIDTGKGSKADLDSLVDLCKILPGGGRCHLLDGAVKVVDSSLYHFLDEYKESLNDDLN
ncbi:NADH-ubiquinone oxidoreductase-F iron-sulfur binding region domain-containing protein [Nitrosomonas mobilis]|nr:NADH-ubiquinone oxidoreductase-F iron-sulfur binding region domain-containing protein [Nitrosomonas mobilis]